MAFLGLLLTRNQITQSSTPDRRLIYPALALIVAAAFLSSLNFPFLADDYSHIWNARQANPQALWAHFTVPEIDQFFRPAVYCSYALDAHWAGLSPTAWRLGNLFFHLLNTLLVYRLCRKLDLPPIPAALGAILFGLHASGPEAVTWVAARFDLMAATFGLACIVAALEELPWWTQAILLALAIMSKESAYAVPVLVLAALLYKRKDWRRALPLFTVAAAFLLYRIWLLAGIGGYHDSANGAATALQFHFLSSLKALLPVFWATLIFPLNWTGGLNLPTLIALPCAIAAMIYLAWNGAARKPALFGILFAAICSLPVHQFLSIGPDLEKSRVLYFASAGLAILFAAIVQQPNWKISVFVLLFQLAALQNNLRHWREIGELAGRTCSLAAAQTPVAVPDLPNVIDGVYFLHTGFPECVRFWNSNAIAYPQLHQNAHELHWDPKHRTLAATD